jgi:TonB family protein
MHRGRVSLFVLVIAGFLAASSEYRVSAQTKNAGAIPEVVMAVAPAYPLVAVSGNHSEEVQVEVQIDKDGLVTSARTLGGNKFFKRYSEQAAKRWRFASIPDDGDTRQALITFAFKIVSNETPLNLRTPIFKLPFRVEVYHTPPEDNPLPQKKSRGRPVSTLNRSRTFTTPIYSGGRTTAGWAGGPGRRRAVARMFVTDSKPAGSFRP